MIGAIMEDPSDDHRRVPRHRALLGGKLAFGEGYFTVDCVVRDLSELGARVKVPEGQLLPQQVYFLELRSGVVHEARVVWRRHPEVGLEFVAQHNLDNPATGDLLILKRLWTESRERAGL